VILAIIALLVLALAAVLLAGGSFRRVPPPFGLAANGTVAWVQDGQIYTSVVPSAVHERITTSDPTNHWPVFSRDGTRMAYVHFESATSNQGDVVVANADGSDASVLDHGIGPIGIQSWSADGRYLAYMFDPDGTGPTKMQFVVRAVDGSTRAVVDTLPGDAWGPSWSPDGQRLAIGVYADGHTDVYVVGRDGSDPRKLNHVQSPEGGDTNVDWSPDGTTIAFAAGDPEGSMRVYLVGLDGAPERNISGGLASATNPAFSPDGSRIAYVRGDPSGLGWQVVIADRNGTFIKTLPGLYGGYQPGWSPDGTKLAVIDDRPGPYNLRGPSVIDILDVAGGATFAELSAANVDTENPEVFVAWQRLAN
jgi:Tol biopolymer transport system component